MKTYIVLGAGLLLVVLVMLGNSAADQQQAAAEYEYRVMSLAEMFAGAPNQAEIQQKLREMMVQADTPNAIRRSDLDARDYAEALTRLAALGWEAVMVSQSNYWVFRRPKK